MSVGHVDPGNWATDLEGGARFGYQLLWVLVLSGLLATLLRRGGVRRAGAARVHGRGAAAPALEAD